jgi:hypothetical protein
MLTACPNPFQVTINVTAGSVLTLRVFCSEFDRDRKLAATGHAASTEDAITVTVNTLPVSSADTTSCSAKPVNTHATSTVRIT